MVLAAAAAVSAPQDVPSWDDVTTFLLQHPLYILGGGALTLAVVPKVLEVGVNFPAVKGSPRWS